MKRIVIGSRGSELALWQANYIQMELRRAGIEASIEIIKTKGDQIQDIGFDKMEGKGFFTKEIEEALLKHDIDLAVHSHKDLETTSPAGLTIAAVSYREDPVDLLVIRKTKVDETRALNLCPGAIVGTSSARRKSQLLAQRDDLQLKDLRGNVPTRINKLREGHYDAILLAKAGVQRLEIDLSEFQVEELDPRIFVPAPAQGVLALQIRKDDITLLDALQKLNDPEVAQCIRQERNLLQQLNGGCQLPMGAFCQEEDGKFKYWASVSNDWKKTPYRIYLESDQPDNFSATALSLLQKTTRYSVFISRKLRKDDYFKRALEANGFKVCGESMTRYEQVDFTGIPECEWIFFSSKNCVKYFFDQHPNVPEGVKIGSIGGATATALKNRGIRSDFTGESNDTATIGKEFATIASGKTVLFPQSTASYRTIQKQFKDQKSLIDMVVYDTLPNEEATIPASCDVLVFTSPTNAMLYLRSQKPATHQKIIAIGKSTADILQQAGYTVIIPWTTSELAMADAVMSLK